MLWESNMTSWGGKIVPAMRISATTIEGNRLVNSRVILTPMLWPNIMAFFDRQLIANSFEVIDDGVKSNGLNVIGSMGVKMAAVIVD